MVFKQNCELIPFKTLFIPYIEHLSNYVAALELTDDKKIVLINSFLEELSSESIIVLQYELEKFRKAGNDRFDLFINKMDDALALDYPVLDQILKVKVSNYLIHLSKIINRFRRDLQKIIKTFELSIIEDSLKIIDIKVNLGDGHNGEGTSIIHLSNGTKLIYKPRNIAITDSYNTFINWVNCKLSVNLKTFKILDRKEYGWLEFIEHDGVTSENELLEYYYKAGIFLMVTLILGSKDYHYENIIASGKNPVIIDQETIIQPFWNDKSVKMLNKHKKIPDFSVLESGLIFNPNNVDYGVSAFGIHEDLRISESEKIIKNANTINSLRVKVSVIRSIIKENIPNKGGKYIFANSHKKQLVDGFCTAYDMFLDSKSELRLNKFPIKTFKNKEIRVLCRPTYVYYRILKYLKNVPFMSNFEAYYSKLYSLLSQAYQSEDMNEYRYILDLEMKQMLNGDIPIINLKSTENFLASNTDIKIFQYNCLENIYQRIEVLSLQHKQEQLNYINTWLDFKLIANKTI